MKNLKKKTVALLAVMTVLSGTTAFASESSNQVAEANTKVTGSWSAYLPANHGNQYFKEVNKTTNYSNGNVSASTLRGTPGVNAWFNTGEYNAPMRISNIAKITTRNIKYDSKYTSHYQSKRSVYLGVEDQEKTSVGLNYAAGNADYK